MSTRFDVDRQVTSWLVSERPAVAPDGLLEAVAAAVAATPRRRGWQILDRWTWRHEAHVRAAARVAVMAAVLAALVLALALALVLIGSARPAPPFGLTRAGFIAFDTADGIVVDTANGDARKVIVGPGGQSISPTWSRDGLHLAYWHRPGTRGPWGLVVVNPDGSASSVLAEGIRLRQREAELAQPSNIAWSPDSRQIAYAADVGADHSIFVASLGQTGAVRITDPSLKAIDPAWKPDGSVIAFQSEQTGGLHVVAPDGSNQHRLAALPHTLLWPDWSPDGSSVATMAAVRDPSNPDNEQTDIFTISADGTTVTDLSRDPAPEYSPTWSPDGSRIAWDRAASDGSARAYIVVARRDSPTVVELRIPADLAPPIWSPDGTRIFSYETNANGAFHELVVIDPDGVAPAVRLPADGNIGNGNWQRLP
jgi:Tol biopolymer transport system component